APPRSQKKSFQKSVGAGRTSPSYPREPVGDLSKGGAGIWSAALAAPDPGAARLPPPGSRRKAGTGSRTRRLTHPSGRARTAPDGMGLRDMERSLVPPVCASRLGVLRAGLGLG